MHYEKEFSCNPPPTPLPRRRHKKISIATTTTVGRVAQSV